MILLIIFFSAYSSLIGFAFELGVWFLPRNSISIAFLKYQEKIHVLSYKSQFFGEFFFLNRIRQINPMQYLIYWESFDHLMYRYGTSGHNWCNIFFIFLTLKQWYCIFVDFQPFLTASGALNICFHCYENTFSKCPMVPFVKKKSGLFMLGTTLMLDFLKAVTRQKIGPFCWK